MPTVITSMPAETPPLTSEANSDGVIGLQSASVQISSSFSPAETLDRIRTLSRRGKLPNFTTDPTANAMNFTVAAFGHPFDHVLRATITPASGGSTVTCSVAMAMRVPLIMAVVLVLTIWPGVWLTDSMLKTYFTGYDFNTWLWYIPLTVLPIPFMWRKWHQQSVRQAVEHANESIEQIRACVTATPSAK